MYYFFCVSHVSRKGLGSVQYRTVEDEETVDHTSASKREYSVL
jgi:hypothetical protein